MRLLGFIILTIFYLENCSCSRRFSVKPQVPSNFNYVSYSVKPRTMEKKSNEARILKTAAEVFESLGNTTFQSFAATFLKIRQKRLLSALKGVSIAARILSTEFDTSNPDLDENSAALANIVMKHLEKLSENVFSNTNFYSNSVNDLTYANRTKMIGEELRGQKNSSEITDFMHNQLFFNTAVVFPINRTSRSMVAYMNENNHKNRDQFTTDYLGADMEQVVSDALQMTSMLIRGKMNVSGYDKDVFEELRSNISRYFFQAFIVQYFQLGVGYARSASFGEMKIQDASFKIRHRHFAKLMAEETVNYKKSFFHGSTAVNIIFDTIERTLSEFGPNGTNCKIAASILDQFNAKYPWRKYAVMVANRKTRDDVAHFGFPKRMILTEDPLKTAFVFMATKNATANKLHHYEHHVAVMDANTYYYGGSLNDTLAYAQKRDHYFQMAVFAAETEPCVSPFKSDYTDVFTVENHGLNAGVVVVT